MRSTTFVRATSALVLAFALAACGSDSTPSATEGPEGTGAPTDGGTGAPAELGLVNPEQLTICSDIPYEPFEFEDPENPGEYTGFDIELIRAIAEGLGLGLNVQVTPFDGIWLKPEAGDCDLAASSISITEERALETAFSDPYFDADQSLLVKAGNEDTTLESLAGQRIGVEAGTTGEQYANDNLPEGAEVVSFDEVASIFLALETDDVAAVLQDLPVNAYRATKDDKFVVAETFPTGEQYGFAMSKENPALLEAVNEQLAELRQSGRYDEIYGEWFAVEG